MRRSNFVLPFLLLSCFILRSCAYVQEDEVLTYEAFDHELWPLLEAFEKEALARGMNFDLNALDVYGGIEEIAETHVAGSCRYSSHQPNKITIDQTFWNNSSALGKEFVLFHELGHCVLSRGHRETADAKGFCISIMQSGLGDCILNYGNSTRSRYLDELFSPNCCPGFL